MEIEGEEQKERISVAPCVLQSLRKLSQLQIELLKYKVEADLDNYCSQIENAHDMDMNTLTQYANSIAFTANCPPNYAQEMIQNPYPSLIEIHASLLANKKSLDFVARSISDVKSIQSPQPKSNEERKNDLSDMAVEDDDGTPMVDEETMSVITQSLFHNTHKKSQKVSWDISDDSSNDYSYSDS